MPNIASRIDICNMALSKIGTAKISSLDEDSKGAITMATWYDHARDAVLEDHDWNFARATETLTLKETYTTGRWQYRYALPTDMVRPRTVDYNPEIESRPAFIIEGDYLFTNVQYAKLVYTRRITQEPKFSTGFVKCLILKLASEGVMDIADSRTDKETLIQEYLQMMRSVTNLDSEDKHDNPDIVDPWIAVRS